MDTDVASLVLRVSAGVILLLHGWNHGFGGGGITGTTRWFAGLGLRPARIHALVSTYLELAAGAGLVVGLGTPVAAAAGIGVMLTAFATVHRANGFFIFRDGYEYVAMVAATLIALATLGPGRWSIDHALGIQASGWEWGVGALATAVVVTSAMLAACWRPSPTPSVENE